MSIKYSDGLSCLEFYGTHTLKQSLMDNDLIGPPDIDEYFALFLQGYIDDYDGEGAIFGEKSISDVLRETKTKIDNYDKYTMKQAMAGLFNIKLDDSFAVYKIRQELNNSSVVEPKSATPGDNDIEGLNDAIAAINALITTLPHDDVVSSDVRGKITQLIAHFYSNISVNLRDLVSRDTTFIEIGTILRHLEEWKQVLISYHTESIDLFIKIHKMLYHFGSEYCDDDSNMWWIRHPGHNDYFIVESYVNYVEKKDVVTGNFLDIKNSKGLKVSRKHKRIQNDYEIKRGNIYGINDKVLFYLELREQVEKMMKIYNTLFKDPVLEIEDNIEAGGGSDIHSDTIDTMHLKDFIINNINTIFIYPFYNGGFDIGEYYKKYGGLSTHVIFKIYRWLLGRVFMDEAYTYKNGSADFNCTAHGRWTNYYESQYVRGDPENSMNYIHSKMAGIDEVILKLLDDAHNPTKDFYDKLNGKPRVIQSSNS
tara:strand:- start:255 stop:1694 length:1440 start_codon:yes stop_codon:yes gene_type:complete